MDTEFYRLSGWKYYLYVIIYAMIQEISALTLFALAILYSVFQLGRYLMPVKKSNSPGCASGSGSCGCKPPKANDKF